MKIEYFPETDSLYIELAEKPSVDSVEVSDGVVIDYDDLGNIVGIDIDQAGKKVNLKELNLERLPFRCYFQNLIDIWSCFKLTQ